MRLPGYNSQIVYEGLRPSTGGIETMTAGVWNVRDPGQEFSAVDLAYYDAGSGENANGMVLMMQNVEYNEAGGPRTWRWPDV